MGVNGRYHSSLSTHALVSRWKLFLQISRAPCGPYLIYSFFFLYFGGYSHDWNIALLIDIFKKKLNYWKCCVLLLFFFLFWYIFRSETPENPWIKSRISSGFLWSMPILSFHLPYLFCPVVPPPLFFFFFFFYLFIFFFF